MFTLKDRDTFNIFFEDSICPVFINTADYRIETDEDGNSVKKPLNYWGYFNSHRKFLAEQFREVNRIPLCQ